MRFEAPLDPGLTEELFEFWVSIFGEPMDLPPKVFLGAEVEHNHNTVYMARREGKLAGTCGLTISMSVPALGGFGEVATDPGLRRSGIATELCKKAVDDFREGGGQALFLGTGNPAAARIYHRLGWRKLAGANVMANISTSGSPEEYIVDFFRGLGRATVRQASPAIRVPMIPLITLPHDWQVLDANTAMFSTRYAVQNSCMGLYRRYDQLARDGKGAWFGAVTDDGPVVGLSTACLDSSGACRVDGFALRSHMETWPQLIEAAITWGRGGGASVTQAVVGVEDEERRALFEGLGFAGVGPGDPFDLGGREVKSEILQRSEL
ncbi:MAG: GNAT family N-acetyltransferase [Chloroflexi bacterium]|nr:GNAT family N-acetyltransferase [Chloroflexota bacterium]